MKKNYFFSFFLLFTFLTIQSQVINDNFEDGDINGWTEGTASHWVNSTDSPITGTRSLKHNLSSTSSESYIYHDISSLDLTTQDVTWQFNLKNGSWDPSSANRFWVYLTANETDLNGSTVDGYAVGVNFSGSTDLISLWKVTDGAVDGAAIITSDVNWNSNNTYGIKVTRTNAGSWELLVDSDGGFDNLVSKGTNTNTDYTFDDNFGLSFDFTSTRAGFLWMDDVLVEGTAPSGSPAVNFDNATSTENETDATFNTSIPVTFSNYSADVTISVTVDASSTAAAADYTLNTSSLTFTGNGSQNISLDINDDADYLSETVVLNIAVTSGTADITTSQHTVTINDDDLPIVINEIHADPDSTNGDANGDGTANTSQDEFVEIYNISGASLDISGWILADGASDRHTFPNGTIIPANEAIVVFGGGTLVTVPGLVQLASTNALGLNNGGDTVIIKNDSGVTVLTEVYGAAGNNQSIARNVDFTGSFVDHSTIVSNPVLFSPGRDNTDNTSFASTVKWTGATDNNWNTTTNWLGGAVPSSSADVVIPAGLTNYPTVSSATTVNSILIESGASLIANAAFTGNATYKRNLPTTNWYLVASPVSGESVQDLRTNNTFANGSGGGRIGIAPYKNDGTAWNYYTNTSTGTISSGEGLSVKLAASGDINFTGTINSNNINYGVTQATNNFNLVGNPFTSYINLGTFFTDNAGNLSEQTVWMWNEATNSYDIRMSGTHGSFQIAPGQAFFVSAGSNTDVTFNTANQSHQTTDTFQKSSRTEISIIANQGKSSKSTDIYYINGTSKGFDNGYDGTIFGGTSSKFTFYSQLVSNNDGRNLAIQSLPLSDIEKTVVPLGLKADSSKEIKFSINAKNLPKNVNVFLEDRIENKFINLLENNYKVTLDKNLDGIGRFYIHTTALKTVAENSSIENVSIYKSNTNTITITGLQTKDASLNVYSILGKKVFQKTFLSNGISSITIPSLAKGIYIFEIKSEIGKTNKKIILE